MGIVGHEVSCALTEAVNRNIILDINVTNRRNSKLILVTIDLNTTTELNRSLAVCLSMNEIC